MIVVLLVAAVDTQLELEIRSAASSSPDDEGLQRLQNLPKSLLPICNRSMLDRWWDLIEKERSISRVYVVTNAAKYKYFERWAGTRGIPVSHIVNDGVTTKDGQLGSSRDLLLALRRARKHLGGHMEDTLVVAGDHLFYRTFDLSGVVRFHERKCNETGRSTNLALYYKLQKNENPSQRGMAKLSPDTKRVEVFMEKPPSENLERLQGQRFAVPMFYILSAATAEAVEGIMNSEDPPKSCGSLVERLCGAGAEFYGMRLPSAFGLIGEDSSFASFRQLEEVFSVGSGLEYVSFDAVESVKSKCYARVGLMGNPSDGFHGKTIGLSISNFWAEVSLQASEHIILHPHPLYDPTEFGSLSDIFNIGRREGYQGGLRLLMATLKKFSEFCTINGIALPNRNFEVRYETNIPRQVGLAGSSAIVTALFKALLKFYGLGPDDIPTELMPNFVLSVETEELQINAGLQDRVVQIYEGLVYMDFSQEYFAKHGHGTYRRLPTEELISKLPLFVAYESDPSDSGRLHSDVRRRWLNNDEDVIQGMKQFAKLTDDALIALVEENQEALHACMNANFDLRRELYGDPCLGEKNLRMIAIAREHSAAAKFPGSGGAVVGMAQNRKDFSALRDAYEAEGFVFVAVEPNFSTPLTHTDARQ